MLKCCFQELNSPAVVKQNGRTSNGGSHILKEQKPSRTSEEKIFRIDQPETRNVYGGHVG
jgi:hypothetical protein